jgi:predicted O-methyltransferase YrrM
MAKLAFTTRTRLLVNRVLANVGLQLGTTVAQRAEEVRLRGLQEKGHWTKSNYDQGLKFEPDKYLTFLRETCLPYKEAYSKFPVSPNGDQKAFYLDNGYFRSVDAEVLYSVIRHRKPNRIIEVGSGFSTRLIASAIKDGQLSSKLTSIDPSPRVDVTGSVAEHIRSTVEDLDPNLIVDALHPGDVLFIDSSHQVITGGDVPYLFLEILPRLRPNVLIHVHDIFLPLDYPEEAVLPGWKWAEQYLVHAFLSFNNAFEILWAARYMWANHQRLVLDVIPADVSVFPPSSLWLEKTA